MCKGAPSHINVKGEAQGYKAQQNRATRNQNLQQFYLPKPRTEEAKKSPFYRGAKLWLKLPPNIRKMEGKEEFKLATKKHFGL